MTFSTRKWNRNERFEPSHCYQSILRRSINLLREISILSPPSAEDLRSSQRCYQFRHHRPWGRYLPQAIGALARTDFSAVGNEEVNRIAILRVICTFWNDLPEVNSLCRGSLLVPKVKIRWAQLRTLRLLYKRSRYLKSVDFDKVKVSLRELIRSEEMKKWSVAEMCVGNVCVLAWNMKYECDTFHTWNSA
jgi:hypothetical protein